MSLIDAICIHIYAFEYKGAYARSYGIAYKGGYKGIYIVVVLNTSVMRGDRSKVYTIIMDPDLHKNLQRVSLAQDTNVSAIIRSASEQYVRNYLEQNKGGEVKAI